MLILFPSVGPGADPGVQAVSPQVTVSHPPGGRLPLLSTRPVVTISSHRPIPNNTARLPKAIYYLEADRPRFEPVTFWVASEFSTVKLNFHESSFLASVFARMSACRATSSFSLRRAYLLRGSAARSSCVVSFSKFHGSDTHGSLRTSSRGSSQHSRPTRPTRLSISSWHVGDILVRLLRKNVPALRHAGHAAAVGKAGT